MRRTLPLIVFVLLAGCSGSTKSVPLVAGAVDSFDDSDITNVYEHNWISIAEGAGTRASLQIEPGGFDPSSTAFLSVGGVRPAESGNSSVVGVRTAITEQPPIADPSRRELPRDVSGFEGLSLAIKGTPGTYIIQLGSASVDDFDQFNAYVEVGETWSEFRLPFSAFKQEGFGQSRPWTARDIVHVAVFANLKEYFSFGLDDVRFF